MTAVPKPKHKRITPKRVTRGNFNRRTREKVFERENGLCQSCGDPAEQIHHVMPKGSGKGRGVLTNAMTICNVCHAEIHKDIDLMRHWQNLYEAEFGPDYYKDEYDE